MQLILVSENLVSQKLGGRFHYYCSLNDVATAQNKYFIATVQQGVGN